MTPLPQLPWTYLLFPWSLLPGATDLRLPSPMYQPNEGVDILALGVSTIGTLCQTLLSVQSLSICLKEVFTTPWGRHFSLSQIDKGSIYILSCYNSLQMAHISAH